jgi:hypothetical protein
MGNACNTCCLSAFGQNRKFPEISGSGRAVTHIGRGESGPLISPAALRERHDDRAARRVIRVKTAINFYFRGFARCAIV